MTSHLWQMASGLAVGLTVTLISIVLRTLISQRSKLDEQIQHLREMRAVTDVRLSGVEARLEAIQRRLELMPCSQPIGCDDRRPIASSGAR